MSRKSFFYVLVIFSLVFITSTNISVKAHPPESLFIAYVTNTQTLNVTIYHSVEDTNSHYIQSVVASINGTTVLNQGYTSQPDPIVFSYVYSITAVNGDIIQAVATCNVGGSLSACIVVGGGVCPKNGGTGIPGYAGILIALVVSLGIALPLVYKKLKK